MTPSTSSKVGRLIAPASMVGQWATGISASYLTLQGLAAARTCPTPVPPSTFPPHPTMAPLPVFACLFPCSLCQNVPLLAEYFHRPATKLRTAVLVGCQSGTGEGGEMKKASRSVDFIPCHPHVRLVVFPSNTNAI
ncbi:hypothetical protein LZ32DRAFT_61645 [Colletotrichum eremochloae]|nr:hypothetical protein LZ32DRAFT_61645 [Colletotrichum eremochloae]